MPPIGKSILSGSARWLIGTERIPWDCEQTPTMKRFFKPIRGRRAVRDFKPELAPPDRFISLSPAWRAVHSIAMNEQPWHVTLVTDKAVLDEISEQAKAWMLKDLPAMPRRVPTSATSWQSRTSTSSIMPLAWSSSPRPRRGHGLVKMPLLRPRTSCWLATDLGLGTCWIGFAQGWLNSGEGHQILNLPAKALVVAPVIVGHPRTVPPSVARKMPLVGC